MSQMPPPLGGGPGWGPDPGAGPGYPPQPGYPPAAPGYPPAAPGYPPQAEPGYPPQPGYGPPPGPGYGPQPGYGGPGGPPPGRKRSPVLPIVIVLAIVAAGVGAYFLLLAGDDGGDPESVARQFFDAMIDGDCGAAVEVVALGGTSSEDALAECQTAVEASGLGSGDVPDDVAQSIPTELVSARVTEEDDSSATVAIEFRTRDGSTGTNDLPLVKVDGDWKVAIEGLTGVPTADVPDVGDVPVDEPIDEPVDEPVDEPGDDTGDLGSEPPLDDPEAQANPELADLTVACSEGDMAACDDLWWATDSGGVLEAYASTCGGLAPDGGVSGGCVGRFG